MKPVYIEGKWHIKAHTEELGDVLLLDRSGLPIPLIFISEEEALAYIQSFASSSYYERYSILSREELIDRIAKSVSETSWQSPWFKS